MKKRSLFETKLPRRWKALAMTTPYQAPIQVQFPKLHRHLHRLHSAGTHNTHFPHNGDTPNLPTISPTTPYTVYYSHAACSSLQQKQQQHSRPETHSIDHSPVALTQILITHPTLKLITLRIVYRKRVTMPRVDWSKPMKLPREESVKTSKARQVQEGELGLQHPPRPKYKKYSVIILKNENWRHSQWFIRASGHVRFVSDGHRNYCTDVGI